VHTPPQNKEKPGSGYFYFSIPVVLKKHHYYKTLPNLTKHMVEEVYLVEEAVG